MMFSTSRQHASRRLHPSYHRALAGLTATNGHVVFVMLLALAAMLLMPLAAPRVVMVNDHAVFESAGTGRWVSVDSDWITRAARESGSQSRITHSSAASDCPLASIAAFTLALVAVALLLALAILGRDAAPRPCPVSRLGFSAYLRPPGRAPPSLSAMF
ncbi:MULTISPECIES: DUF2946 family protein [Cobetia]|uniref:DUF2946 domain-containing protein n=1 Tax=Cobetia crustatorum TaxID=553385 RepID=A0A558HLX4_9GAMM|nr:MULTISPECIES: DUF2946 family protein [Cobetia]TVU70137.1 hypothetical protein FQP86_10080 [Cobetia crustatorum]